MLNIIFLPLLVSFLITVILVPFGIKFANYFKLVDDPKRHKHPAIIHTKPIPRAGGLPIFLAILISLFIFMPFDRILLAVGIAGFSVVLVGLLDDKFDLSPYFRFFTNIVAASIVVFSGIKIPFVTNPFGGILHFSSFNFSFLGFSAPVLVAEILAVLWIVWVMNMLNWSKGVDGQMPGIIAISAIIIGIASLRFPVLDSTNIGAAQMAFIVSGAAIGFLVFNFHPAKIFPGYSSVVLGFMVGVLSILSSVKLATAILVMGVPMTDAVFTVTRRILSKKSPFWHDRGHLHHLLLGLGFGQRSIAVFYWVMSLVLGLLALNLSSKGKLFAIILVIIVVTGFILTLKFLVNKENGD